MKSIKSLERAQKKMRERQQQPRGPGRPALNISRYELLYLWARGYSPRGMAIHFGCDQRTILSRLAKFFPDGLKLSKLPDSMVYYLAMNTNDQHFLDYFLERRGPKIDRSMMLWRARLERRRVEREYRQRQKLEAEEKAREIQAAGETNGQEINGENGKKDQNNAKQNSRASRGWTSAEFFL
jgi:hypothetical protein